MDTSIAYSYAVGQAVKSWLLPDGLYQVRTCQGYDEPEGRLVGACDNLAEGAKEHQAAAAA